MQPAVTTTHEWSHYQLAIFEAMSQQNGVSYRFEAVAGSGKTTVIEEGTRRNNEPTLYLCFNKRNADEAKTRMPAHVNASTFHSACLSALTRGMSPRPKVDGNKTFSVIRKLCNDGVIEESESDAWFMDIVRLVGLAKNAGIDALIDDVPGVWMELIAHHDLTFDEIGDGDPTSRVVEIGQSVLAASNEDMTTIDFDDMLYLTVRHNIALPQYPLVCVDEAQDTNLIQQAILTRVVAPGGRLMIIGDSRQAIYGFRGATSQAMQHIAQQFDAQTLPLSVNYRCSKAVIRYAQTIYPGIEYHDNAPEGSVNHLTKLDLRTVTPDSAILCRTTAPIITLAYRMLSLGMPCTVLGREIGKGLTNLIKKIQGNKRMTIEELQDGLTEYRNREVTRLISKGQDAKAQAVDDKIDSIFAAIDALGVDDFTVNGLIRRIESLFDDNSRGRITLATVHKSKGLEWNNVYILNRSHMPARWAKQEWQQEQEINIIYIAITRARLNLYTIDASDVL